MTIEQLIIFFEIILIDLVLAGDNAIIIGMVASQFKDDLRKKIKTSEIKEVVLIADKSLLVKDINIVLYELKQNQINNIKLLSSLNAN
mgnify:CR=1 FL=1